MGKDSDFKRVKHHHMPGDVGKTQKIAMREGRYDHPGVRGWVRMVIAKTRAVLKRRTQREIEDSLEEDPS